MSQFPQSQSAGAGVPMHFFVSPPAMIDGHEWRCVVRKGALDKPEEHYEFRPEGAEKWFSDSDWIGFDSGIGDLTETLSIRLRALHHEQIARAMAGEFVPNANMVRAAENLVMIMAHEDIVRPIVEAYEVAILAKHQFRIARRFVDQGCDDQIVLDPKRSYLLEKADAKVFHQECLEARDAAGLKVSNPENCPALEARSLRTQAENVLLDSIADLPNLAAMRDTSGLTLELRKRAVDLTLSLLASFCSDADGIVRRLKAS